MFDVWPGAGCPETVRIIRPLGGGSRPRIETPCHCTSCSAQLSSLQDLAIVNPFHHPDLSEVDILIFVVFGCESSPISRNVRSFVRPLVSQSVLKCKIRLNKAK